MEAVLKEIEQVEAEIKQLTGPDNKNKRNRLNKRLTKLREDNGVPAPTATSQKQPAKTASRQSIDATEGTASVNGRGSVESKAPTSKPDRTTSGSIRNLPDSSTATTPSSVPSSASSISVSPTPSVPSGGYAHVRLHQNHANELSVEAVIGAKSGDTAIVNFPDEHTYRHESGSGFEESLTEEQPADHEVEHIVTRATASGLFYQLKGNVQAVSYRKQAHGVDGQRYFIQLRMVHVS